MKSVHYGGFWHRFGALFIDAMITIPVIEPVTGVSCSATSASKSLIDDNFTAILRRCPQKG